MNTNYIKRLCKSLWHDMKRPTYKGVKVAGVNNDTWIPSFIVDRLGYEHPRRVAYFTVNSFPELLRMDRHRFRFLCIMENVHVYQAHWELFVDIQQQPWAPNLTMGFDYIDQDNYLRFPYWLIDNFTPMTSYDDVADFVHKYNFAQNIHRERFCAFICRKDYFGDRATMADLVESIEPLTYPSDFRHNDDAMRTRYKNDKIAYLNSFRFNLCPENTNNRGYVTEKIFHAVKAGCVPVYWGNEGFPETNILNKDAIIYLDRENPKPALDLITLLNSNDKAYAEFASQPRFTDNAVDEIYAFYRDLENRMRAILEMQ